MSTRTERRNDREFIEPKDWGTKWFLAQGSEGNFEAKAGYVTPGPTTPLATDWMALTETQVAIMEQENAHYRRRQAETKLLEVLAENLNVTTATPWGRWRDF